MTRVRDTFPRWLDPRFCVSALRALAIAAFALAVAVLALPAAAQAPDDDDLPGRVGRIADFAGQLFIAAQDVQNEWSPVGVNYPVTTGDNLWVSGDGRAEVDYGGGQVRLGGDTNLHVSRLDDRQLALFVAQGRLIVRVRVLDAGDEARIDTPNTQVTLTRPGLYRIDVAPDRQTTTVAVREGEALVALASGVQQALPGQALTVVGPDPAQAEFVARAGTDGFDKWSADRDRRYERGASGTFVSRQMVGIAELDEYGYWETNPTYGSVWYPTAVAPDWAPYRYGYWTSVGGWGLTWVDAAPWGYAPSHYGRWVRIGARWGWCPGAYVARPHWAPALVGWVGGAGWGVSVAGGAPVYGWVPLGWGDAYNPWWRRCSNRCWTHYNRPYAVNVAVRPSGPPPRYANASVHGALTAVPASALGTRRPVSQSMVPLPSTYARSAPVLAAAPAVAPARAPGVRPGERGTPPPASSHAPRSWHGRDARDRAERPPAVPGATPPPQPRPAQPSTGLAPLPASPTAAPRIAPPPPAPGPQVAPPPPTAVPQAVPPPPSSTAGAPQVPTAPQAPGAPHGRRGGGAPGGAPAPPPAAASVPAPSASAATGGPTPPTPAATGGPLPSQRPATLPAPAATGGPVPPAPAGTGVPVPSPRPATAPSAATGVAVPSPRPATAPSAATGVAVPPPRPATAPSAATGVPVPPPRPATPPSAAGRATPPPSAGVSVAPVPSGRPASAGVPAVSPPAGRPHAAPSAGAAASSGPPARPAPSAAPPAPVAAPPPAAPAPATQHAPQGRPHGGGATSDGGRDPGGNTARK